MKIRRVEPVIGKSFVKIESGGQVSLIDHATAVETKFKSPLAAWQEKEKRELDIYA